MQKIMIYVIYYFHVRSMYMLPTAMSSKQYLGLDSSSCLLSEAKQSTILVWNIAVTVEYSSYLSYLSLLCYLSTGENLSVRFYQN